MNGIARTTNPGTALSDGQGVTGQAMYDKNGRQIVVSGHPRELKGIQTTLITSSTGETTIVTAGATGVFNDLYLLTITNYSATDTYVTIKDATSGTTRFIISVKAGTTAGFSLNSSDAVKQNTAANNWTAACHDSVDSISITALFVKNV